MSSDSNQSDESEIIDVEEPTTSSANENSSLEDESNNEPLIYDKGPMGWAFVSNCGPNGTTGAGDSAKTVTVKSSANLKSELSSSEPKIIYVEGKLTEYVKVNDVKDKTIIGKSGAVISGGMRLNDARNVIIKNIVFTDGHNDSFELSGSECVWFDHNTFRDGGDGNLDIVRGSNFVTVSWSRFYYTRASDHMLSNLNGNSNDRDDDIGKINITMHHNWWGKGVLERMPRVRYGKNHLFNNYYKHEPVDGVDRQNYVIGAGQYSKLLVENNYFDGSKRPIAFIADEDTAEVVHRGNAFVNTSGDVVERGKSFEPPYNYKMDAAKDVKKLVREGAGAR